MDMEKRKDMESPYICEGNKMEETENQRNCN